VATTPAAPDRDAEPEPVVELDIEQLVAGGEGLARPEGQRVVFVRGALPGERVRARVVERHRGFERAELVDFVTASAARVEPPCPLVGLGCGGCDLQHSAPTAQPAMKAATVVDALRRLGHVDDPMVVVAPPLPAEGFRTTVRAAVERGRAGFRRRHSHDVVTTDHCLVAHPLVDELIRDGRFGDAREATLRVGAATGERMAIVAPRADDVDLPDGVIIVGADELKAGRRAWIHEEVDGRRWRISAQSFFQTRPDGAAALADAVVRLAGADIEGARVVDAYAGVGLLSAAASTARARSVQAVERSASSVADGRVNLADLDVRIVRSAVERWRPSAADVVIADPARAGLGAKAVDVLLSTRARVVVLVSCDAASLGRDAALLAGHGLRLEQAELVDLFPHSHHVEVVARFAR
jgi:23S rRNA (uracil1939-C5)-methyltransferase